MSNNDLFYRNLPSFERFQDCVNHQNYYNIPDDWYIVLTDVVNSTKIIESGRYKDVNVISVLAMTSLMNLIPKEIELPFLFGGDGVTFFVPESLLPVVKSIIEINQQIAIEEFDLKLRGTFVAIKDIYNKNYELKIAKQKVSNRYAQACIIGDGIDYAEQFLKVKDAKTQPDQRIEEINADVFKGFHCPFENINPRKEEIISIIIKSRAKNIENQLICYENIFKKLDKYLNQLDHYHPLEYKALKFSEHQKVFDLISKVETWHKSEIFKRLVKIMLPIKHKIVRNLIHILQKFDKKPLLETLISSDYKKLDGALKMTLTCNQADRIEIESILNQLYSDEKIYFGIHKNDQALITCSVLSSNEVHLIDGSDGGYAFASRGLKKQFISKD